MKGPRLTERGRGLAEAAVIVTLVAAFWVGLHAADLGLVGWWARH